MIFYEPIREMLTLSPASALPEETYLGWLKVGFKVPVAVKMGLWAMLMERRMLKDV